MQRAIDYIRAEHPRLWERHGGRDHVFMALGTRALLSPRLCLATEGAKATAAEQRLRRRPAGTLSPLTSTGASPRPAPTHFTGDQGMCPLQEEGHHRLLWISPWGLIFNRNSHPTARGASLPFSLSLARSGPRSVGCCAAAGSLASAHPPRRPARVRQGVPPGTRCFDPLTMVVLPPDTGCT